MAPPDPSKPGKKRASDGKAGKVSKRGGGRKQVEGKKGAAKDGGEGLDFGAPLQRRGLFAGPRPDICPLRNMMYGYGDVRPEEILNETVDLVEDIVIDYCSDILKKAVDLAAMRGTKVQAEDILFLLRKDVRKFARAKELLSMNEEIKQARKQFEDDEALLKK